MKPIILFINLTAFPYAIKTIRDIEEPLFKNVRIRAYVNRDSYSNYVKDDSKLTSIVACSDLYMGYSIDTFIAMDVAAGSYILPVLFATDDYKYDDYNSYDIITLLNDVEVNSTIRTWLKSSQCKPHFDYTLYACNNVEDLLITVNVLSTI